MNVVGRRANLLETAVFLLVLLPLMGFATIGIRPDQLHFSLVAVVIIVHDVALTGLALYFVWRNSEGGAAIGWTMAGAGREVLVGIALFVPMMIGVALIEAALRGVGVAQPTAPPAFLLPHGRSEYAVAIVLLVTVAVSEETIFRGYLIRRLMQVTGSRWLAVMLTSILFALGHGYQGTMGVIAVGVIGVVLALVYLKRGSLVAPMTMHFIQDFVGLIIAPQFFS